MSERGQQSALAWMVVLVVQLFSQHGEWRVLALAVVGGEQWLSEHRQWTALDTREECQFEVKLGFQEEVLKLDCEQMPLVSFLHIL